MKFSVTWLQKFVDAPININDAATAFTQLGFEVESMVGDVIDLAIPPNRGDCLGLLGIARELAALTGSTLQLPDTAIAAATIDAVLPVQVISASACPQYLARVIKNIDPRATTPPWMVTALADAGINSISAVVDITNYVMLELGQPLHAFALQAIDQAIVVRHAKAGEQLELLDKTTIKLHEEDLVIADLAGPIALAGIMGGQASAVQASTTSLLLECAYFAPIGIRLSARRHGLATDAAYRFERGVDPCLQEQALARAANLLQQVVGGQQGPVIRVTAAAMAGEQGATIRLRRKRIQAILSVAIDDGMVVDILTRLGMRCVAADDGWQVTAPSYRADVTIEVDLIEELARFIGYQAIPTIMPQATLAFKEHKETEVAELRVKACLQCRGFAEVITYSFLSATEAALFAPQQKYLELVNPISSDLAVMRPNLLPGLVKVLQYNENRQLNRVRIFELGLKFCFSDDDAGVRQEKVLAGLCAGPRQAEHWDGTSQAHDFFDLKGDIQAICKLAGVTELRYERSTLPILHPGRSATIFTASQYLGFVGELHPQLLKALGLTTAVLVFELNYAALLNNGSIAKFCPISKFPGIRRDLAIIVDAGVLAEDIAKVVRDLCGSLLQDFFIFDVYCGQGIAPGKKSIGLGVVLQHDARTLVDEEIKQMMEKIVTGLQLKFNATLR